jgi:CBS domain-containing protein
MHVRAILKQKGKTVATVAPTVTLAEVASRLAAKRIGAIVVVEGDRQIAGIISERDIIRAIAQSGPGVLSAPVSEAMTRTVSTCVDTDTLDHLMQLMTRGRFRHLPVVDRDGKLDGIVSIGDVVKYHVEEIKLEAHALRDYIAQH